MQNKLAVIDADSIIFILAWHNREHRDEKDMELQVDQFMVDLITTTGATHYLGAFSPARSFREDIYPEYKANRRGGIPSEHIAFWKPIIKQLCRDKYGFIQPESGSFEADDILSIMRGPFPAFEEIIFCSPDKDIRQIPGKHYDYSKQKWEQISQEEADRRFWMQMLVGDSTDNVPGCKGIGEKKAPLVLEGMDRNDAMMGAVHAAYVNNKKYADVTEALEQYSLMAKLLTLQSPKLDLVTEYGRYIQEVAYADSTAELNIDNGVLQSDQRSLESDVLRPSADLPEQV